MSRDQNHIKSKLSLIRIFLLSSIAIIPTNALPIAAQAQTIDEPSPPASLETEASAIIVTGSLLAREGFRSPTPITSLNADDLRRVAAPNIADAINQLPALRATLTPTSTTNYSVAAGQNFLDLRGLGTSRTLLLVDGRRYVPTSTGGGVSLSSIPQALIKSVDIVTGGASAAYGSDAVAGVVNLGIDDKFEGVKGSLQGGITDHNDYRNYLGTLAFGKSFNDGKLRIVLAGEAAENDGIASINDRGWGAENWLAIANPLYTATNTEPQFILAPNVRFSNASYGGVINSAGPLRGLQFDENGAAVPFNYGTLVTSSTMSGGDGARFSTYDGIGAVPIERFSGLGRVIFEPSEHFSGFVEAAYSELHTSFGGTVLTDQITLRADNAFLPESVRQTMQDNDIASIVVGKSILDNARTFNRTKVRTLQLSTGMKADLGSGWNFDAFYSFGQSRQRNDVTNARITARFNQAIDAVVNPANGQITCRSTLSDPSNGCVPFNVVGIGRQSAAATAWVNGSGFTETTIRQHEFAATVRGEPFSTPAGAVGVALGVELRRQTVDLETDALTSSQQFRGGGAVPYDGDVNVKELFGEVLVPLVADAGWAKNLNLNAAVRLTDYSTSGTVTTWKAGVDYAVSDSLRFRATRSRDIRAPALGELFAAGSPSTLQVTDPANGQSYLVTTSSSGNRNLKPERADTISAGVVFTPDFIPGFRLSLDYFDIRLKDAIISLTPQTIVTNCFTVAPQACSLITRTDGLITSVANSPLNLNMIDERGIDAELGYSFSLASGKVSLRGLITYIDKLTINDGTSVIVLDGAVSQPTVQAVGGTPHWRANASVDYVTDRYRGSITARYVGGGKIDNAYTTKNQDVLSVDGRTYVDLSGEVTLHKGAGHSHLAIYGAIQNLLNSDPPITGVGGYGTTRSLYDTIGRVYTLGARFQF